MKKSQIKKITMIILISIFIASPGEIIFAGNPPFTDLLVPTFNDGDVYVPQALILTIPGFTKDSRKPVYAICGEVKGMLDDMEREVMPPEIKASLLHTVTMEQKGRIWKATGMRGKRFIPAQIDENGKLVKARLGIIYRLPPPGTSSDFIDNTDKNGPFILIK